MYLYKWCLCVYPVSQWLAAGWRVAKLGSNIGVAGEMAAAGNVEMIEVTAMCRGSLVIH